MNYPILKKSKTKFPDPKLLELRILFDTFTLGWRERSKFILEFPQLMEAYHDQDQYIEFIKCPNLPDTVKIRYRFWDKENSDMGRVDLIIETKDSKEINLLTSKTSEEAIVEPFSINKGIQVSLSLPQMNQDTGFSGETAGQALRHMETLISWYLNVAK